MPIGAINPIPPDPIRPTAPAARRRVAGSPASPQDEVLIADVEQIDAVSASSSNDQHPAHQERGEAHHPAPNRASNPTPAPTQAQPHEMGEASDAQPSSAAPSETAPALATKPHAQPRLDVSG